MNPAQTDNDVAEQFEAEIIRLADEGVERIDWPAITARFGLSSRQLARLFVARTGTTPARFLADLRAQRAQDLLRGGHDVLNAAVRAGYSGPGRLHDAMVLRIGMTPGEVRTGADKVAIAYGLFRSPIGDVLIARTTRGICAIRICGDRSATDHLADLQQEFPRADFSEDPEALQQTANDLVDFLEDRLRRFDPPLDLTGTPFQHEVWAELRRLSPGETVTYSEVARRLNRPAAVRAVASAVARNPVAIAIPCHRVIRTDGGLGGYRWGLPAKEALLKAEKGGTE